jgi:septal ring factor EnvC (AmiA/AmiB activator)
MKDIPEDRSEIREDIKAEQTLEKELHELEEEAVRLEKERVRRLAALDPGLLEEDAD